MPHTGNIDTGIPGPYPPAHMGGHGASMDVGDVLWAGVSGQIAHFDHDLNYKQHIVTRHAIDPDGTPREIEVTDACWDSRGRLYVCLYSPVLWATPPIMVNPPGPDPIFPQIQWFDNNAVDLGRFDQDVFFSVSNVFPQLFPYGICCLRNGTFAVLAAADYSVNTQEVAEIVHLGKNGELLAHYTNIDQDFGSGGMDQQSLEVGPDGYTVYYCDHIMVRRFDMRTGLNVAPIPVVPFTEGVVVLPDGGIVVTQGHPPAPPPTKRIVRRYTLTGTVVWERIFDTSVEPGDPAQELNMQALGMDRISFYSYFNSPNSLPDPVTGEALVTDRIVKLSLEDGSILDWKVSPAIPYTEGSSWMTVCRTTGRRGTSFGTVVGAT